MKTEEVSSQSAQTTPAQGQSEFWKRRGVVATSVLLSMLTVGICAGPAVLTATSMRNSLLNSAIGNEELMATAASATGGWFAPLVFHDVRIQDAEGKFVWTVKEIRTEKGVLSFITDSVHIGEIRLTDSSLKVRLNDEGQWPLTSRVKPSKSELTFRVENGSLELSVPWREIPIVELSRLTIAGNIGPDVDGHRMLNIDPVQLLDHEALSDAHTHQNLALIAPVLSQSTTLSGSASVWLDEMHIPLDENLSSNVAAGETPDAEQGASLNFPIHGRAEFHALDARLKENWTRQLTALVGQLSGTSLPDRIQVLKDSKVEFSVSDDGISHDGMVFLLPQLAEELTFTSSGIVHLDETLDLLLTVTVPNVVPAGRPFLALLSQLMAAPIQLRVVGTVSEPKLQFPEGMNLLSDLTSRIAPAGYTEEAPPLTSAVFDLIQNVGSQDREKAKQALPGNILNIIRAVDEQAKQKRQERKSRQK
ncbi:MAG: hypothetical protein H7Z17_14470 [Fuerstia sp.]|nr:hypothetical protein [Fuerstiella sp.]